MSDEKVQPQPKQATLAQCNKQLQASFAARKATIEMMGPAGRIMVPANEELDYRQKGYSTVIVAEKAKDAGGDTGDTEKSDDGSGKNNAVDFTQFDLEKLKEFGKLASIKNAHNMKEETLIAKLIEVEFDPSADTSGDE